MQTCFHRAQRIGLWLAVATLCVWVLPAPAATDPTVDPPDRVARVAYVAGEVGLLPHGAGQWRSVDVNRPLTAGDRLSTGTAARVELGLGRATVRLAGDTDFGFLQMDDGQTRAALTRGTLQLDVRDLPDGEDYEIDTPQVAVVVDRAATVRVDLGKGDATTVSVREGSAVVYGSDGARQVLAAGQGYRFADTSLDDVQAVASLGDDAFYRWCRSREQRYVDSESGQYVSADTVGYQDLDDYGQWQAEADYGQVWFPDDVGADWVPYRHGHWAWIEPWGWTWISDAAWGFAPFHYGRWHVFGGRWGWIPGPIGTPAVYAPALVAFVGGAGWQVSVGIGEAPIGWYPLGPGVVYNPWYTASRGYYWRVNHDVRRRHDQHWRKHVDEAYNVWRKPKRLGRIHMSGKYPPYGITVVSRKVMAQGRDVRARLLHVDDASLRRAPVRFHGVHVRPEASRRTWLHAATVRRLPVKDFDRPVVARRQHPFAVAGKMRSEHTPWATPVRLLDHPRVGVPHRPLPAKRLVSAPVRAAAPPRAVHGRVPPAVVRARGMHDRPELASKSLPVVPRLRVGGMAHAPTPTTAENRHEVHPQASPRRLAPAPRHFPTWTVRQGHDSPSRVSVSPRPDMPRRWDPPPVRAVGESRHHARPQVVRPVRRPAPRAAPRPVPRAAPKTVPVPHAVRFHAGEHPVGSGGGKSHGRPPVHFKTH